MGLVGVGLRGLIGHSQAARAQGILDGHRDLAVSDVRIGVGVRGAFKRSQDPSCSGSSGRKALGFGGEAGVVVQVDGAASAPTDLEEPGAGICCWFGVGAVGRT